MSPKMIKDQLRLLTFVQIIQHEQEAKLGKHFFYNFTDTD